jgi:multiple sugar transport system ATP-binding protein
MNVFPATLSINSKTISFDIAGGAALSYPAAELSRPVRDLLAGKTAVTLGVRPHALHAGKGALKGKVTSCQWLGDQTHVAVDVGGRTVVSVSHERVRAKTGADMALNVAAADLHIFDPETGAALAHGGEAA